MKSRKLKYLQDDCDNDPYCNWCKCIITGLIYWGYIDSGYGECQEVAFLCDNCKSLDWKNLPG